MDGVGSLEKNRQQHSGTTRDTHARTHTLALYVQDQNSETDRVRPKGEKRRTERPFLCANAKEKHTEQRGGREKTEYYSTLLYSTPIQSPVYTDTTGGRTERKEGGRDRRTSTYGRTDGRRSVCAWCMYETKRTKRVVVVVVVCMGGRSEQAGGLFGKTTDKYQRKRRPQRQRTTTV